jgi:hypothetical protein
MKEDPAGAARSPSGPPEPATPPTPPPPAPPTFEKITIDTHRGLITKQAKIFKRFNDNPELSRLLFVNPVLAFREAGIELSTEIAQHVMHTLQHTPEVRTRRQELEDKLTAELGEPPQPTNPAWLSKTLFEKLKLQPLDTRGRQPTYEPPLNEEVLKRLQALRPKPRHPIPPKEGPGAGSFIRLHTWRSSIRRMDLDAPLPDLKPAKQAPKTVSLETLYFYKDSSPLVRDLLELGQIQKRGLLFQSTSNFRKVVAGEKRNAFHSWIKSVTFPEIEERHKK